MCYFVGIFGSIFKTTSPSSTSLMSNDHEELQYYLPIVCTTKFARLSLHDMVQYQQPKGSTCLDHHL
eukprot:scaffold146396_cov73-Cyclotella_meneghiniana.AAC.5